jgi:glycosyltransferase involved in cell wall biosynthesis
VAAPVTGGGADGSPAVTVAIPVKDGARYLTEVLEAVAAQELDGEVETLVVDSGSTDGSLEIARGAGARVEEIPPEAFGHGRTRNRAMELARGERVAFLTQDATPADTDWLRRLVAPLSVEDRVGLSFGPHLPRADTRTPVARELEEFFGAMSPGGAVRFQAAVVPGPAAFFSNVNSCVHRRCWEAVRFRDVAYAEDQAFARDAMAAGWRKAFVPQAPVLHAHDYPWWDFMRRYFDEYRGLRLTVGHVEPLAPRALLLRTLVATRRDVAFAARHGGTRSRGGRTALALRSAAHHGGRAVFSALGARSHRLPSGLERRLSLEGTGPAVLRPRHGGSIVRPRTERYPWDFIGRDSTTRAAPLAPVSPAEAAGALHLAWVIPPYAPGSGGHTAIFRIVRELERAGHSCSVWVHDPLNWMPRPAAVLHREIVEGFAPIAGPVFKGLEAWTGADVAIATGWQTAYAVKELDRCRLRGYLVLDDEPEFYPTSAQSRWAEETYRAGLLCLAGGAWLRDLLRERHGADAEAFHFGLDHDAYADRGRKRDPDTVLFYARPHTPRRGTELGILALAEVIRRRPQTRVVMFGDAVPPDAPFDYELVGVASPERLAELYNGAAVGMALSLTNYSLVPQEMMACGLPVVDVRGPSAAEAFGADGEAIALAEPEPGPLADVTLELLDDPARRASMAGRARERVAGRTWESAAREIEAPLRDRLGRRAAEAAADLENRERAAHSLCPSSA